MTAKQQQQQQNWQQQTQHNDACWLVADCCAVLLQLLLCGRYYVSAANDVNTIRIDLKYRQIISSATNILWSPALA